MVVVVIFLTIIAKRVITTYDTTVTGPDGASKTIAVILPVITDNSPHIQAVAWGYRVLSAAKAGSIRLAKTT